ncbi:SRPBCC family protein [Novosphingobium sp. YAF33]|uniref:SRPBCC family protein n=1 Tax=Novosphingobium sp. YAF33 TaxID=3233082 RepID=UPI003F9CA889
MIETEQSIVIDAPIEDVWGYAKDINGWAKLMPGLQDCAIIDDDDSHWTLKVGVGALVRTVKVFVHVNRWSGPGEVDFAYSLQGDPVRGGGVYRAKALSPNQTEVTLGVQVIGEGPMAPMWEAMGKPLLPKFARAFAEQFKAEIKQASPEPAMAGPATDMAPKRGFLALARGWLRRLFRSEGVARQNLKGESR